jgi:hypothetical protein
MGVIKGYLKGIFELKIHTDALLLTGVEDFSTADDNFGGNEATIFMATQRQRSDNADDNIRYTQ